LTSLAEAGVTNDSAIRGHLKKKNAKMRKKGLH
jgi:hypothetical protein